MLEKRKSGGSTTTRSRFILFAVLLIGLAGAGVAAFSIYANQSVITVENQSRVTLENVEVTIADTVIWTGSIAAGATETARGSSEHPGPVGIAFDVSGQHYARLVGDVSPGKPEHGTLQIQPNFNIQYLWPGQ